MTTLPPARRAEIETLLTAPYEFGIMQIPALHEAIRDLLAALPEWRPIETAPKADPECPARGPLIWLGGPGWAEIGWWAVYERWAVGDCPRDPPSPPTYWQPLPEPPA